MERHFSISDPEGMKYKIEAVWTCAIGAQGLSLSHE
jgi:hypothetical protein